MRINTLFNSKGFTLIELLLVVMIIGFMLAVVLPRGLRVTTDAKYNLVRQNASELAAYANDWIEQQILAQDEDSSATRANYLNSLVDQNGGTSFPPENGAWIADTSNSNWNNTGIPIEIRNRRINNVNNSFPENSVEEIIDPAKILRNPFNGASIFLSPNQPTFATVVPGAITCSRSLDTSTGGAFLYYGFIFQGTDSKIGSSDASLVDYHGGQAFASLPGIREGVFFTKTRL
jgi:prepilin-type N-terminal cleavage/methylation domain-containing protein